MIRLTKDQVQDKVKFISKYVLAENAASGSAVDANANVTTKNIATLQAEMYKDFTIQVNRSLIRERIEARFGQELAEAYINDLQNHTIYVHDESSVSPYCTSISMYPFLIDGLTKLGGESKAPTNIESFTGSFVNLIFAISSQFAGAVASVEFLPYLDYFARKSLGNNYLDNPETRKYMEQKLQHVVYCLNQPAAARGYQCVREDTTQLMTPNGWKYLKELSEGDSCYTYVDGKLQVSKIDKLNVYSHNGKLLRFSGRGYQQTVTPNHRVLYKKPNTDTYDIREAHELVGHSNLSLPVSCEGISREDFPISDEMLQLAVIALTDGSIDDLDSTDSFSGRLTFYHSPYRWVGQNLHRLLTSCGIAYTITDSTSNRFGELQITRLTKIDSQSILRTIKHSKKELPYFFTQLSSRQARLVVDTWSNIDGQSRTGGRKLQCDNDAIADALQIICQLAGIGSHKEHVSCNSLSSTAHNSSTIYIKLYERDCKRISNYTEIEYTGNVWCPTTKEGVVVMREENGVPYITGNSVFWNISVFDSNFFLGLFKDFYFPDGTQMDWPSVERLQRFFISWFREERKKALLTFPVVTLSALSNEETGTWKDQECLDWAADEYSKGSEFFIYTSPSVDSLSSCCRLRNSIQENEFSYSLGAGGIMTGSKNVITLNINRIIQTGENLSDVIDRVHKYQVAHEDLYQWLYSNNLLTAYSAGFIDLKKQYLTLGINGVVEAAEYLGYKIDNNEEYRTWLCSILGLFKQKNKEAGQLYSVRFNTECVPAENLGVKNAAWDKKAGLKVPRDCYNSYFYLVEDTSLPIYDKLALHGGEVLNNLDGGSAVHFNNSERLTKIQYRHLFESLVITGSNYFCENVLKSICTNVQCGYIHPNRTNTCPKCGAPVEYATRIIGYLKKIANFSTSRQSESARRYYHTNEIS